MKKNKEDIIIDNIDNITFNKDTFPIKNMHALKYNLEGLYYLANTVRNLEIEKYRTDGTFLQMISLEHQDLLMNMFNWFSISVINYLRLVGFVDCVNKNAYTEDDLNQKHIKNKIKQYTNSYCKGIIPEIVEYRNKLSAHHSLFDPKKQDNIATLISSALNTIVYRQPYYEASMFMHTVDGNAKIEPWILTKTFDDLAPRFWPDLKLPEIPTGQTITNIYKGLKASKEGRDGDALNLFKQTIEEHGNTEEVSVMLQVAMALVDKGSLHKKQFNYPEALKSFDMVISKYGHIEDEDIQVQVSMAMFNKIQTLVDMKVYDTAIHLTDEHKNKFSSSENELILRDLGDLMVNKSGIYVFGNNLPAAINACDETYQLFSNNNKMLVYAAKALVNKANYLFQLKSYQDALETCENIVNSYKKSTNPLLRDQASKAETIKRRILVEKNEQNSK